MNIRDIDLNLLSVLDALISERSVTRASERLDLSQPATSNALRRLRALLDDQILVRSGNTMVPTPRALELQPVVRKTLDELNAALFGESSFDPASIVDPINIATTDADTAILAATLYANLRRQGVHAPLRFLNLDPTYALAMLESGAVNLAVGTIDLAPESLHQARLGEDRFCCVMRAGHPLAGKALLMDDYTGAEHILVAPLGGTPRGLIDAMLAEQKRERTIAVVVQSFFAALDLARRTDLLATLPLRMAKQTADASAHVVQEPLFLNHPINLRAFWHPRHDKSPLSIWLRREVRAAYRGPSTKQ